MVFVISEQFQKICLPNARDVNRTSIPVDAVIALWIIFHHIIMFRKFEICNVVNLVFNAPFEVLAKHINNGADFEIARATKPQEITIIENHAAAQNNLAQKL